MLSEMSMELNTDSKRVALLQSSRPGVSNSVSYAGHILTKKGLINRKNVSAGRKRRLKVPLYYKNSNLAIIWVILMMSRAAQPHLAGRVFKTPALDQGSIVMCLEQSVTYRDHLKLSKMLIELTTGRIYVRPYLK